MRSNCVVWALLLYLRRSGKGRDCYIAIRRSRWGAFPHFLYVERRAGGSWRCVSYVPMNPRHKTMPPPIFRGRWKWGDS